jgi:hypothetical protein
MSRLVDPQKFRAKGALIDWLTYGRMHGINEPADVIAERRKITPRGVHLRWAFDASLGYPMTPFTVWARAPHPAKQPVNFIDTGLGLVLDATYVDLWITVTASVPGLVMAFPGMPLACGPMDWSPVGSGKTTVRLTGPGLKVLTVPLGCTVDAISGAGFDVQDDPAWQPIEIVGLPSDGQPSAFTDLINPQGMIGALSSPIDAALDRFNRGAPFYGWDSEIVPGVAVPSWVLADPIAMIKVFNSEMLGDFIDMCDNASPSGQQLRDYTRGLQANPQHTANATFNPLRMLLYGGVSDPLASLILGLGTAYPWDTFSSQVDMPPTHVADASKIGQQTFDFMITATFVDNLGRKIERAALILGPTPALPPPAPASMTTTSPGVQAPVMLDDAYRSVITTSWDTASELMPFDIGSHALARRGTSPSMPVEMVMDPRPFDVALQPLGASRNASNPIRRSLSDSSWPIDSSVIPNSVRYAAASQNIFGLWSRWSETAISVLEPPVSPVSVTAARLDTLTASGPCPASITLDLTWNWTSRSPQTITLVGRLYSHTWPSDPPSNTTPPAGNTFVASGAGDLVTLSFNAAGGITAVTAGAGLTATAQHLTIDGQHVSAVPLSDRNTRRYRVTVSGFSLNFDSAPRWGVALWAYGVERRLPNRAGTPGTQTVVSAADPRPPVITSSYDNVTLASLRDADGLHHARLSWSPMTGAVAYQVYTCSEATFRTFHLQPEQRLSDTLTQRLTQLQSLFGANPERRPFTRVGSDPVTATSLQVSLPRGTKEIHMYLVIGVSSGNVESAWPATSDPLCGKRFTGIAAPMTVIPGTPTLEVTRGGNGAAASTYHAKLKVTSVPGAEVGRIDIYRVRVPEAAAQVETMGPPLLSLIGSTADWTVTPITSTGTGPSDVGVAQPLGWITGSDPVPGSWKPVFYRAVAWAKDDPTRGQYGTRSAPSTPRSVVVPPSGPPDLASPVVVLPTTGSADARIDFATAAPVWDTVIGPHRLEAEALLTSAAGAVTRVALTPAASPLSGLAAAAPGAGASGFWRDPTAAGSTPLHLLVRRADPADSLSVRLRLTDPLGRITERVVDVPPGAAGNPPDIVNPVLQVIPNGWLLVFLTHAPDTAEGGPIQLEVSFKAGRMRPSIFVADLADLPRPPRDPTQLLASATPAIPAYGTGRRSGSRTIGIGFRQAGTATITLTNVLDQKTTITRTIGRRLFP